MDPSDFEEPKKAKPVEGKSPTTSEQHEDSMNVPRISDAMHHVDHARVKILAIAFLFVISGSMGFLGGWLGGRNAGDANVTTRQQQVVLKTQGQLISNIAKTVGASVVSIDSTGTTTSVDSFFGTSQQSQQESAGTGIIISADGLIITNRHVVPAGTTNVDVTLSDGTLYKNVQVVGRTSSNDTLDIAFLKIKDTNGKKLVPAQIGQSSKVQIGDSVVAIGNALGQFQNTVTSGIISGHGRSVQASDGGSNSENLDDLFQTDAAINEGNSGGPLVNLDGEVIGINTAIAGGAQNIGFAIPIDDVSGLIQSVEQNGKLQRPYLGVLYVPITADVASQYNLSVNNGAYIAPASISGQAPIVPGGPAAKAGLKEGDIITKVGSDTINNSQSLTAILDKHAVGDTVTLTIIRGGKTITANVTLGAAPAG